MILRAALLFSAVFWLVLGPPALAVGVDPDRLEDPAQEARAERLMDQYRCLVCQNQSIAESNAEMARDLRELIRERIRAGDSDAEIEAFLTERYGDWILLRPPVKNSTALLWLAPLLLVLAGGALAVVYVRRRRPDDAPELSAEERQRARRLLEGEQDR
ncbi:MAG: cytochrome c-type biogenesis protein [Alphaproteobacteria bacterium]|nr:cytochrome c-type biogenesis protein [Alphaproteobacteria bacterium]